MAYLRTTPGCPWYVYWCGSTNGGDDMSCRRDQLVCIDCKYYISYNVAKDMYDIDYIIKAFKCTKKEATLLREGLDNFIKDVENRIPEIIVDENADY